MRIQELVWEKREEIKEIAARHGAAIHEIRDRIDIPAPINDVGEGE